MQSVQNKSINYVQQAFSISDEHKAKALSLYKEAVSELVQKDYIPQDFDAHTDLSAIFGEKWIERSETSALFPWDPRMYVEANIAFNYANCLHAKKDKFIALAKQLVDFNDRVNDRRLGQIASQMNSILTATTLETVFTQLIRLR